MALHYDFKNLMGEVTISQRHDDKDVKFKIMICRANCLAAFVYSYKKDGETWHQLYSFFNDVQHAKNIAKEEPTLFWDKVVGIKLNTYYKESITLLKLFTKAGHKVTAYYKEPKK